MGLLKGTTGHVVGRLASRFIALAAIGLAALPLVAQTSSPLHIRRFSVNTTIDVAGDKKKTLEPLSPQQKFEIFYKSTYDPFRILSAGFQAGINQATNSPEGYGQGAEGYGKRVGAAMADAASSEFFGRFLLPTLLRQDPRYYRRYESGFGRRFGYALTRVLVTRTDSGGRAFNFSQVGGALASASISNLYYPDRERGMGQTLTNFGYAMGAAAAVNFGREFWPDIAAKLFHHHQAKQ